MAFINYCSGRSFSTFILFLVILIIIASCSPHQKDVVDQSVINTRKTLTNSNKNFIRNFYPAVSEANKNIMKEREQLLTKRRNFRHVINNPMQMDNLNLIAARYRFGEDFFHAKLNKLQYLQRIDTLLCRVDYLPEKLVMAQAIIESGWGKSKFAVELNNYFGIRCYTPGCGRAAAEVENPNFWVKEYPTIEACLSEYLWTLNTGQVYEELRNNRKNLRDSKQYPNAIFLAQGLARYSEKGDEYIRLIEAIINDYLPENLPAFVDHHSKNQW